MQEREAGRHVNESGKGPFRERNAPGVCMREDQQHICAAPIACLRCDTVQGEMTALPPVTEKQFVRVYTNGEVVEAFQRDAATLAAQGWCVQRQTVERRASDPVSIVLLRQFEHAARRTLKELTVVYARD